MNINLLVDEIFDTISSKDVIDMNENAINEKYEIGYNRIVTEQGSFKLPLLGTIFSQSNYTLQPEFQRRITWDDKKRSRLIESFIINIPIPPVFIFEKDFDNYEVMDGLQRISAIISFYNDEFELTGLDEWSELNGLKYSQLPQKIREGIDRRQLSSITLLKESSKDVVKSEKLKKMVFERLNTGGVKLEPQEIRNALYNGSFNKLCINLSSDDNFRKLWNIVPDTSQKEDADDIEFSSEDELITYSNDKLYKRMYDVELVLRFFAMRHLDEMQGQLSIFLDNMLISGNRYSETLQNDLADMFKKTMKLAYKIFGEKAFCMYKPEKGNWTSPQRTVYDPLCLVIENYCESLENITFKQEQNIEFLKKMFIANPDSFNGKKQSKTDIKNRYNLIETIIKKIIAGEDCE